MSERICGCLVNQGSDAQHEVVHWVTGGSARRGANVGHGELFLYEKILSSQRNEGKFIFMCDALNSGVITQTQNPHKTYLSKFSLGFLK